MNQPMNQPLIDLYDEYTHRPLDRRVFLERLIALAGSTAAAQAFLSVIEPNYARAAVIAADDPRVGSIALEASPISWGRNWMCRASMRLSMLPASAPHLARDFPMYWARRCVVESLASRPMWEMRR